MTTTSSGAPHVEPGFVPDIPGPDPSPLTPAFKAPPLTCDAHCHIFGPVDRYPYAATRPYTPPEAPLSVFKALHARIGVERAVIVNATPYGRDNTVILDAIAQSGGRYRGIGNVDDRMTDRELERLASSGIDGCRFTSCCCVCTGGIDGLARPDASVGGVWSGRGDATRRKLRRKG